MLPPLQVDVGIAAAARLPGPIPSPTVNIPRPSSFLPPAHSPLTAPTNRPPPTQYAGTKRAHEESFRQDDQPHYNGARDRGNAEDIGGPSMMSYKRADGKIISVPAPHEER